MQCDLRANTMLELLSGQAALQGDNLAYMFLEDSPTDNSTQEITVTYAELDRRARAIAAELQTKVKPGDRAMLVYPAGLDFIAAFFGCLYAGVVAVPATYPKPRRPLPRMNRIAIDCGAHVALTTSQTLDTIGFAQIDPEVGHLDWIATDNVSVDTAANWCDPKIDGSQLAFLQYTSGSTSDPKGVMVSHGNLLSNLAAIESAFGIGQVDADHVSSTGVFWLPAYHDMGLIGGILTPLYVGGRSVLMSPTSFLQRPIRWLQAIDHYQATISGAPNFAYELCVEKINPEERAELDLSKWRLAFCGAEPIRADMIERFTKTFAPQGFRSTSLYPCYGLAESTLLAAGPKFDTDPAIAKFNRQALAAHRVQPANGEPAEQVQALVGCGETVIDHELLIVDPESNQPVGESHVGEIMLQGPSIAQGYWNCPKETAETFAAKVPGHEGEFLRTGDLGFIRDGEIFVTGRLKDVIIIRGRNHYPQDIEQTTEATHAGILAGAAFSVPVEGEERLVVVHSIDRQYRKEDWEKVAGKVRRAIVAGHELDPYAIVFIRQTSLPITSSGKVQRNLCREQYLQGELKVVHQWTTRAKLNGQVSVTSKGASGHLAVSMDGSGISVSRSSNEPNPSRVDFTGLDVDRAAERIELWVMAWLIERVGLDPVDLDRNRPFAEYGVDSLTAVELSQELEDQFGVPVTPVVAWNHPTPAAITRYLAEQTTGSKSVSPSEKLADDDLGGMLDEIENLSEEEALRLLAEEE